MLRGGRGLVALDGRCPLHACAHRTPQDLCRGWGCRVPPLPKVSLLGHLQMGHCTDS